MYYERKSDLSLYYLMQTTFSGTGVNVVDGFPEQVLTLPTVAVDVSDLAIDEFELGNREGQRTATWNVDIFAINKSQRDEIGYKIINELKNGITVYNYDEGFPPENNPSKIGHYNVVSRRLRIINILPELVEKMYYRATVRIVAINDEI